MRPQGPPNDRARNGRKGTNAPIAYARGGPPSRSATPQCTDPVAASAQAAHTACAVKAHVAMIGSSARMLVAAQAANGTSVARPRNNGARGIAGRARRSTEEIRVGLFFHVGRHAHLHHLVGTLHRPALADALLDLVDELH